MLFSTTKIQLSFELLLSELALKKAKNVIKLFYIKNKHLK